MLLKRNITKSQNWPVKKTHKKNIGFYLPCLALIVSSASSFWDFRIYRYSIYSL